MPFESSTRPRARVEFEGVRGAMRDVRDAAEEMQSRNDSFRTMLEQLKDSDFVAEMARVQTSIIKR